MRKVLVCLAGLVLFYAGARVAVGQTVQGVITGTIFDASGAAIPNATVTITNEGTGISQTRTTGPDGVYRFPLVPPGTYTVTVTAAGFAKDVTRGLVLEASLTLPLNVTMQVAKGTTTVEVTTQGPLVQTATSDLTETVTRADVESLPMISRDVFDLAFLAPSVSVGMDFNPAAGGTRESGTQYMLNGSDNNDNFSEGAYNITPPLESVQEFTILTNSMGAQYGRAAGAVVSASQKSGTNKFHGAAYEFNQNKSLNSSNYFENRISAPKPAFVRNNFGGEIDGPIKRDKTFFSFAYDQVILDTAGTINPSVPTPANLAALQAAAGPIASSYLSTFPPLTSNILCPSEAGTAGVGNVGCIPLIDPDKQPAHNYFGRFDQNFSAKDRLSFTANINRTTYNDKYGGGWVTTVPIDSLDNEHYHNFALVETHTFGNNVFNEVTVGQNRHYSVYQEGGGKYTDPVAYIDGASYGYWSYSFGAYEGGLTEAFVQDRWQLQDNLTFVHGRHSIKIGGGWQHGILYRNWDLGSPGYYDSANAIAVDPSTFVPEGDTLAAGVTAPAGYGTPNCPELSPIVPAESTTVTGWNCYNSFTGTSGAAGAAGVTMYNADGSISNTSNEVNYPDSNFAGEFPYAQELSINPQTGARANAYRHYIMNDNNLFVQDDWKVRPHFSLNIGLRWERYGAPTEEHGVLAQFTNFNCASTANTLSFAQCIANVRTGPASSMWKTRNGDLGPRVGFAWDVFGNGRTSLRGSFGISYDRIFDNVWSNGAWNPPFYALLDSSALGGDEIYYSNPPTPSPSYVPNSIPSPGHRVSVRTMENNLKDASAQNYFLGVEHQFASNFLLRVNYQASLGRHLPVLMNWNRYDGLVDNPTLSWVRPNALYSGFNYRADNVSSNYNSLVVEMQKRLSHGLLFQGSYTWSHLLDIGSDLFSGSTSQGAYSQPYYYESNDHENLEYGNGAFDHRHSFKLALSYELPWLRNQHGVAGKVAGGWQLTSFLQAYSGHPLEVYSSRTRYNSGILDANGNAINIGGDYNLDGTNNDRPDWVGGNFSSAYSHQSPGDGIFKDNNPIGCGQAGLPATVTAAIIAGCNAAFGVVTPNSLFVNPAGQEVRFGTLARNAFFGPWLDSVNAGMFKNFKVTEATKLQIRIEAYNLPNHPNFDYIVTDLNSGQFGKSQGLAGIASRTIQIGARFLF